jgi:aryl-alcohol dehydrogenase-like predicted oxidoreductase
MVWGGNADPSARSVRNLSPDSIRREVEDSLRRLGVERIDLYQFHWPDQTGVPVEESWATMGNLVQEGKIRAAGVSNFSVDLLERAEAVRHVDSLQPPFSLITRSTASDLLPWARKHGTGVIAYAPMQNGLLTGAFSSSRVADLADDDWRKRDPQFTEPQLSQNLALVESLRAIAERHQSSLPAVAIAWALAWRGVTGAIAGARSPEQLRGWIGAMELELSMADLDEIGIAIAHTGAGNGPVRPELDA